MDMIKIKYIYTAISRSYSFVSSNLVMVSLLTPYVLLGGQITAEKIFTAISLYGLLNYTMANQFPAALAGVGEARISLARIQVNWKWNVASSAVHLQYLQSSFISCTQTQMLQDFLEVQIDDERLFSTRLSERKVSYRQLTSAVHLSNVIACWGKANTKNALRSVSMTIEKQKLCAIVGPVGCGKVTQLM
jgi:ATP-binding cassette subfamily C (CFTR/MRP) protein 4